MSTELAKASAADVAVVDKYDQREMIETIKQTVCKGATDAQLKMFIEVCRGTGLNPFLKEIWFVPNVGVMAARDGYLRIANEHPQFDGMETTVERGANNVPIKATCKVWRKDRSHPITCEAYYDEYKKSSQVWQTYKSAMIAKVAEVLALKRSFSINGVVTEEEIGEMPPPGSTQAQKEVPERKLQVVKPEAETVVEIAPEQEPKKPPKAKAGTINFDGLKQIGEIKTALRELTGTDEQYYDVLAAAGVAHANELTTASGREVWKALAKIQKRLTEEKTLRTEIEGYALKLGPTAFVQILGNNGYSDLDEFIQNADGTQAHALIADLKNAV